MKSSSPRRLADAHDTIHAFISGHQPVGRAAVRSLFTGLDRLTAKLAMGIALLVILPLGIALYLLSGYHFHHTLEARRKAAELENRILGLTLRHQMLDRDQGLMTEILEEVGLQEEVRGAMVLDHDGVVRLSSHPEEVGTQVSRESAACLVCHAKTPSTRQRWVMLEQDEGEVLRSVLPIANRPECHSCHDPAQEFNGILILDISMAGIREQLQQDIGWLAATTATLSILLLGGVGLLLRRLVLIRLNRLSQTARSITAGALTERAETGGHDVISSLARDFNDMADATSELIEAVQEREQRMAGVLNSLDDGLIVMDRDYSVVAANRSMSRRLCEYPENLQGRRCQDAVGHALPCDRDTDCPTARCLETGKVQRAIYNLPDTEDGNGRVQEVYASPVYSQDGSVMQVVEVWRDITERVREEERLAEIERLSSLGVLASGLSHEINTPLASTLTSAESILGRLNEGPAAGSNPANLDAIRESAGIIRDQVLRCRKITDRFLRFARGIPPSIEPIDLQDVVKTVLALARPTAKESGIRLEFHEGPPVPVVTANTEVVQHVVLNILVNAIESFDGGGGEIVIRFVIDSHIRLRVQDTGCGIPVEFQPHLFEPFATKKRRGTGLGLFLSRNFMRRFGGDVRLVESTVGKGSCIEILFPRPDQEAP
jgi:PAS domain S-box-containing protein